MRQITLPRWIRPAALGVAMVIAATAGVIRYARGSDHQDTPEVELNPAQDMTDVYAFPGSSPDRIVLVLNSWPFLTPGQTATTSFDPDLLYQFKIDNNADGVEDKVIQVTFHGRGVEQTVEVRGPVPPPVVGAMDNRIAQVAPSVSGKFNTVLSAGGMQVFAGPRDDPFFIDLEQFFRILPDRKPVTGPLGALPDTATASSFRPAGSAVDFVAGYNVLSIVIELPISALTAGGTAKIGLWGTISR